MPILSAFADALRATATTQDYELVVVESQPSDPPIAGARSVLVSESASLAARWNAGARAARGELLVFASAHATPLPGWLDALVETYRSRPDTGCVGSKILAADGTIGHAGLVLGPDRVPYRVYEGDPADAAHVNRPRIMPAVLAEGMVTSRAQFVAIGGFDETLGDDLTDADYCLRLRARGCPALYAPSAALRSPLRPAPGTRTSFRSSAREFSTRWSPTAFRSDELDVPGRRSRQQPAGELRRGAFRARRLRSTARAAGHRMEQPFPGARGLHGRGARSRRGARRRRPPRDRQPGRVGPAGNPDAGAQGRTSRGAS